MSETASFVDPVFLARFGLGRFNVLDYFLHPLNPFRTKVNTTSNEILSMQGITIGMLMQYGLSSNHGSSEPMSAIQAEEEYNNSLKRLTGEQYQLLPPYIPKVEDNVDNTQQRQLPLTLNQIYMQPSQLYVIRHVFRTSPSIFKVLGIYYIVEGIIYKSPSVRSVCKTNITRTLYGLSTANQTLSICARYLPSTGYTWVFEEAINQGDVNDDGDIDDDDEDNVDDGDDDDESEDDDDDDNEDDEENNNNVGDTRNDEQLVLSSTPNNNNKQKKRKKPLSMGGGMDPVQLYMLYKKRKRRKALDHRRPGERTAAEEEGIRASESIDQILVRISKTITSATTTTTT